MAAKVSNAQRNWLVLDNQYCSSLLGLIAFWSDVVFRCITHQELPEAFGQTVPHEGVRQIASWYTEAVREPSQKKPPPTISIVKRKLNNTVITRFPSIQSSTKQPTPEIVKLPQAETQTKRETMIWD